MKCVACDVDVKPTEIDLEAEIVQYDCKQCKTSWHLLLGAVGEDGLPIIVIQDESTWFWKVCFETDPSFISETLVPGKKAAIETLLNFIKRGLDWDEFGDLTTLEFSANADPQHPETDGRGMNIWVNVEITSAEYISDAEAQATESALLKIESELE